MQTMKTSRTPPPTPDSEAWRIIRESIASLPNSSVKRLAGLAALNQLETADLRRKRIINLVQEALSQVRLDMKYLVFDLEVTRKERDSWKSKYYDK